MPRILVIDDDQANRESLRRRLERRGFPTMVAVDGLAGLALIAEHAFDLILLDVMMPGMSGLEVLERIRETRDPASLPVVMATAKDDRMDIVAALERGANDYVTKPLDFEVVLARVNTQLALKKSFDTIAALERSLAQRNTELESANTSLTLAAVKTQRDLALAAKIQESLLPVSMPTMKGVRFAWAFEPCTELAGDSLTISPLDPDHVGMYVLDVSGHGVAASLLAVAANRVLSPASGFDSLMLQGTSPSEPRRVMPPADVARRLSQKFAWDDATGQFITMFYGLLNVKTLTFTYSSAGHPPAVHLTADRLRPLDESGPVIGLGGDYDQHEIPLSPSDRIFMYSDGVTEAMNAEEEQFGFDNLCTIIESTRAVPLDQCVATLLEAVKNWRGGPSTDDISILVFEIVRDGE